MGQAFVVVNLDKKQFLEPLAFNEFDKISEFGTSSCGLMTALALLTSSGNGEGMGDFRIHKRSVNTPLTEEIPPGFKLYNTWTATQINGDSEYSAVYVPNSSGLWAGDRVVTLGAYSTSYTDLITKEEELKVNDAVLRQNWHNELHNSGRSNTKKDLREWCKKQKSNLRFFQVVNKCYENIGETVAAELLTLKIGNIDFASEISANLLLRLENEYLVISDNTGRCDMRWCNSQQFDFFLLRYSADAEMLRKYKKWLRKQKLHPWQREIIKFYTADRKNSQKLRDVDAIDAVLRKYQVIKPDETILHGDQFAPSLLPVPEELHESRVKDLIVRNRKELIQWLPNYEKYRKQPDNKTTRKRTRSILIND